MTEKKFVISLSELRQKRKFIGMAGEKQLDFCLFEIQYRTIAGLPFYELRFPEEDIQDIGSNNAADIIEAANEYFEVMLVP